MTDQDFVIKALNVPFKERGRDYEGWDCYGVPFCYFRDVKNIKLPEYLTYSSIKDYKQLKRMIDGARPYWKAVTQPKLGDIAVFRTGKSESHIGLVIDHKRMLHSEKKVGTFIELFNGLVWGLRLEGVYRYVG